MSRGGTARGTAAKAALGVGAGPEPLLPQEIPQRPAPEIGGRPESCAEGGEAARNLRPEGLGVEIRIGGPKLRGQVLALPA